MFGERRGTILLFLIVGMATLAADLLSKSLVFQWVESSGTPDLFADRAIVIIPGWLQFITRFNEGGMWSIGHQFGADTNTFLGIFASLVGLIFLFIGLFRVRAGDTLSAVTVGLIFGAALGNASDRFRFGGVRDFIDAHYYEVYHYPTFNVADSCLVIGLGLLLLSSFFSTTSETAEAVAPEGVPGSGAPTAESSKGTPVGPGKSASDQERASA